MTWWGHSPGYRSLSIWHSRKPHVRENPLDLMGPAEEGRPSENQVFFPLFANWVAFAAFPALFHQPDWAPDLVEVEGGHSHHIPGLEGSRVALLYGWCQMQISVSVPFHIYVAVTKHAGKCGLRTKGFRNEQTTSATSKTMSVGGQKSTAFPLMSNNSDQYCKTPCIIVSRYETFKDKSDQGGTIL